MTSRERVAKVLNHEMPDRIPNCLGGCETAGLHILAYSKLVDILGLPKRPVRIDTFMFNAVMDEDVLLKMNGDMLLLASPLMCRKPLRAQAGWNETSLFGIPVLLTDNYALEEDPDGRIWLLDEGRRGPCCPKGGLYFDNPPKGDLFDDSEVPDPKNYHPSHELPETLLRSLEETAKNAYESTDFALCMGETLTDLQLMPGGMMAWYEAMINEPEIIHEYLGKAVEAALDQLRMLDQAIGKYCQVLSIAHDLGDQKGVTIGAELFRELYKPHYTDYFQGWHKLTDMKVNLHSCGSVAEIIPDLIECGVDILNPVQLSAAGMSAKEIRRLAGDQLVLYGGALDCILTPAASDPEFVYQQVRENIQALSEGGNYLFAGVHNTVANTPAEHLKAMLDAYEDCCR